MKWEPWTPFDVWQFYFTEKKRKYSRLMINSQYQFRNMEILVDNKTVLVTEECIACVKQVTALGGYSEETQPELRPFPL